MKILVSSCQTGGRCTNFMVPQKGNFDVTFKCYDSSNFPRRNNAMHPRLLGKIPKMLAHELHPNYDVYIWIDGPFSIRKETSIQWYLDQLGDKEAAFFKHPNRNSVKEELDFCIHQMNLGDNYIISRYSGEDMENQVKDYYLNPLFKDDKLFACTSFIYHRKMIHYPSYNVMKEWFYHNCRWSVQDQLSLPYLLTTFDIKYNAIDKNVYETLQNL